MKTLKNILKFVTIKTSPLLLMLGIGGYAIATSANDFNWNNKHYTNMEDGRYVQINVIGNLVNSKSVVQYDSKIVTISATLRKRRRRSAHSLIPFKSA